MTNTELPDLTTWYRVPDNTDIPEDAPFAIKSPSGRIEITPKEQRGYIQTSDMRQTSVRSGSLYFTDIPLGSPKEKLPTALGSVIQDVVDSDGDSYRYLMLVAEGEWAGLSDEGIFYDYIYEWIIVGWSHAEDSSSSLRRSHEHLPRLTR